MLLRWLSSQAVRCAPFDPDHAMRHVGTSQRGRVDARELLNAAKRLSAPRLRECKVPRRGRSTASRLPAPVWERSAATFLAVQLHHRVS